MRVTGVDLDTQTTAPFASMGTKIIVWVALTGCELILQASETHVEGALEGGKT